MPQGYHPARRNGFRAVLGYRMPPCSNPYDVLEGTLSLCPVCLASLPATLVEADGRIYVRKHCPDHGPRMDLLEEDAGWFRRRNDFSRPGSRVATQTLVARGCPHDCGLCPSHEQHSCIALLELTSACDGVCPACFAAAGPEGRHLDLATAKRMIDFYLASEDGQAEILQISGGEPTLHPQVLEVIRHARERGLAYVMLNTNGRRIAQDPDFARALAAFTGGFEVYLQFDGLDEASVAPLRGPGTLAWRREALDVLERLEIPTTLVMTVQKGVNDHALGDVVGAALARRNVRGVNFQPLAFFGRLPEGASPEDRVTLSGVLRRLETQTRGQILASDFIPLPCDVDRVAVDYLYRKGSAWIPVTRGVDFRGYLPYIRNTFNFRAEEFIQAAGPAQGCCSLGDLARFLSPAFLLKPREARVAYVNDNVFRLSCVSFLDAFNFDLKAMQKECVHVLTPDLRKIPFSAWNLVHRGKP